MGKAVDVIVAENKTSEVFLRGKLRSLLNNTSVIEDSMAAGIDKKV